VLITPDSFTTTKYFEKGIIRYTSSETEGLTNEMIAANKAMPGISRGWWKSLSRDFPSLSQPVHFNHM